MIEIGLESRSCDYCGEGHDLETIWSNQSTVTKSTATYLFRVHVVVCRKCGFCFTSPSPRTEDLTRYYADSFHHYEGIALPYSIDRRLALLERYRAPSGVFAEISGSQAKEFHRHCAKLFGTILNVEEPAEGESSDYRSIDDLPSASVDVISHYDVLEHVPNAKGFLTSCHRALKPAGLMVCEVPDVRLYPRNIILNESEHLNHFSVATLAGIAQMCGFKLVEIQHNCSRPYGFASVFRKDICKPEKPFIPPFEYLDTKACVLGGIEQVQRVFSHIETLKERIAEIGNHGKKVTLWAVTDMLRRLLENFTLPETAMVVDQDPRRHIHLEREGVSVFQPKDCRAHIRESELLAIFAPRYQQEILDWVVRETGRSYGPSELEIVGTGPSGEALI